MSNNEVDLTNLLGSAVDDIEDLPDFVTLPNCEVRLRGKYFSTGESSNKNPKISATFELVEITELSERQPDGIETDLEKYPAGSLVSFSFIDKEAPKVLGRVKKVFGDTMKANGMNNFAELADNFDSLEFLCVVTARPNKDDPNQFFGDIKAAEIGG